MREKLSPDQLRALQGEAAKKELAEQIEAQVRDALARFPRPAGIDPLGGGIRSAAGAAGAAADPEAGAP